MSPKLIIINSHGGDTMIKSNLPVILLKGLVVLPLSDARVELNNNITKKIVELSKINHNDDVLVVTPVNDLEVNPDTSDLPNIGVIAKITSKIELPNGNVRVVLKGIKRVRVTDFINYPNEKDILLGCTIPLREDDFDEIEETALLRKLLNEVDKFISVNPYISNSILNVLMI